MHKIRLSAAQTRFRGISVRYIQRSCLISWYMDGSTDNDKVEERGNAVDAMQLTFRIHPD